MHTTCPVTAHRIFTSSTRVSCPPLMPDLKHGPAHPWTLHTQAREGLPRAHKTDGTKKNVRGKRDRPVRIHSRLPHVCGSHNGDIRHLTPQYKHMSRFYTFGSSSKALEPYLQSVLKTSSLPRRPYRHACCSHNLILYTPGPPPRNGSPLSPYTLWAGGQTRLLGWQESIYNCGVQ